MFEKLYTRFGRTNNILIIDHQKTKEYVQHVIKRNAKKVYELLHDLLGIVYVCGYVSLRDHI